MSNLVKDAEAQWGHPLPFAPSGLHGQPAQVLGCALSFSFLSSISWLSVLCHPTDLPKPGLGSNTL